MQPHAHGSGVHHDTDEVQSTDGKDLSFSSLVLSSWVQFDGTATYLLATFGVGIQERIELGMTKNGSSASGTTSTALVILWFPTMCWLRVFGVFGYLHFPGVYLNLFLYVT